MPRILLLSLLMSLSLAGRAEVSFSGLDSPLEKNARALMTLASATCDAPEWRVRRLYRDAGQELRNALEALGHYRFEVDSTLSFAEAECWEAAFDVSLGEPVVLRDVSIAITGEASDDAGLNMQGVPRPQVGDVLNHGIYETYKSKLISALTSHGYFDATLATNRVVVDETRRHAEIELEVASGPRYRFGKVTFSQPILAPELLAAFVKFRRGDPYDSRKIAELHEQLSGSGYFSSVSIQVEPQAANGLNVPVRVSISPGKRRVFTAGAGYATDTGVQGRLGYTNRRRNVRGHQFDSRLFLSSVDSELTANYRWPRGRPDAEWVDIYGGFLRKRTGTSESDKTTLGIRVSRNRNESWIETPYLELINEQFTVGGQTDTKTLLTPGIKWERTNGRNLRRQPRGYRISFDVRGAHEKLASDTTFLQGTVSTKWIASFGPTRLLARADFGATSRQTVADLPATVRYFAGGDTSVRGYDYETIGPEDAAGNVIGGANLAVLSLEADWLVRENWGAAAFVDSGTAFDYRNVDFKTGVGVGVRWYSPVGPIRLDIARPLDDVDNGIRLHITLGPDL